HLPANISSAVDSFCRQWRIGEQVVDAVVETHRVLRGIASPAAAAGFVLRVDSLAENDLVAVRRGHADQALAQYPSGDGLALGFRIIFVSVFAGFTQDGFHMRPVATALDDDEFVAASGFPEFRSIGTGG